MDMLLIPERRDFPSHLGNNIHLDYRRVNHEAKFAVPKTIQWIFPVQPRLALHWVDRKSNRRLRQSKGDQGKANEVGSVG